MGFFPCGIYNFGPGRDSRNPFQGGMGFFPEVRSLDELRLLCRNPFQGGMGFFP